MHFCTRLLTSWLGRLLTGRGLGRLLLRGACMQRTIDEGCVGDPHTHSHGTGGLEGPQMLQEKRRAELHRRLHAVQRHQLAGFGRTKPYGLNIRLQAESVTRGEKARSECAECGAECVGGPTA